MPDSKEGALARAVLDYAKECLLGRDLDRLALLGLRPEDVDGLTALPLAALDRLAQLCRHGIRIEVNGGDLRRGIDALKQSLCDDTLQRNLIRADAPRKMMRALFGMSPREFRKIRLELGVTAGVGRPGVLDEKAEMDLWNATASYRRRGSALSAEEYLELWKETRIPLRSVWPYVQQLTEAWAAGPSRSGRDGGRGSDVGT